MVVKLAVVALQFVLVNVVPVKVVIAPVVAVIVSTPDLVPKVVRLADDATILPEPVILGEAIVAELMVAPVIVNPPP
jgi:hypothetical protein